MSDSERELRALQDAVNRRLEGINEELDDAHGENDERLKELISCPICLEPMQYAVSTCCGHSFCGQCIFSYWKRSTPGAQCVCPVDRKKIELFIPAYVIRSQAQALGHVENAQAKQKIDLALKDYNRFFSSHNNQSFLGQMQDNAILWWRSLRSEQFLPTLHRALIWLAIICQLLYILLPFDLIPEATFGFFGFLDDLFVFILVILVVGSILRSMNGG